MKCSIPFYILFFLLSIQSSFGRQRLQILDDISLRETTTESLLSEREFPKKRSSQRLDHKLNIPENFQETVVVFKNNKSHKLKAIRCEGIEGGEIELPPLLWRELLEDINLYSWTYGIEANDEVSLLENWTTIELDQETIHNIQLPQFKQRINGIVQTTSKDQRQLISVSKILAFQNTQIASLENEDIDTNYRFQYTYLLSDGTEVNYIDFKEVNSLSTVVSESVYIDGSLPFIIHYNDEEDTGFFDPEFGDQIRASFEWSIQKWADHLSGDVPVEIDAYFSYLGSSTLGSAGSSFTSIQKGPKKITYNMSLANNISGYDIFPSQSDITIVFNSAKIDNFFYATDENEEPSFYDFDFVTVALHEITHGLGMTSSINEDGSLIAEDGFIFDQFIYYNELPILSLSNAERQIAITSEELFWEGSSAMEAYNNRAIPLYAPNPYENGSSVSHWDNSFDMETFMTYTRTNGEFHREIDEVLSAALLDLGWQISNSQSGYQTWINTYDLSDEEKEKTASPSGDGISNLIKYATGLSPLEYNIAQDYFLNDRNYENEGIRLLYRKSTSATEINISAEWTTSLSSGTWSSEGIYLELIESFDTFEIWQANLDTESQIYMRLKFE